MSDLDTTVDLTENTTDEAAVAVVDAPALPAASETPADEPKVETFRMGFNERPFQKMKEARDAGDEPKFNVLVQAMSMCFGHGAEVIVKSFDATLASHKARIAIEKFEKEQIRGWTATDSLINMMLEATEIAESAGGSVTFGITLVKATEATGDSPATEDSVSLKCAWRGIDGVGSTRGSTGPRGRYEYFDGGAVITTSLKKHLVEVYPSSNATGIIEEYAKKENSGISAWDAAQRGMKKGDTFVITRVPRRDTPAKGKKTDSSGS
jgi:hypothetical protein